MFKNIFKKKVDDNNKENKAVLIAALLIHAAKIDENYADIEKEIIKKAIINLNIVSSEKVQNILKKAEQTPVDMEQSMILEWLGTKNATMEAELESMMHNKVNIEFLKEQVTQMQKDVELLKDKVRQNGAPE